VKAPQTLGTSSDQVVGLKALARFIVLIHEHEHEHALALEHECECDQLVPSNN